MLCYIWYCVSCYKAKSMDARSFLYMQCVPKAPTLDVCMPGMSTSARLLDKGWIVWFFLYNRFSMAPTLKCMCIC